MHDFNRGTSSNIDLDVHKLHNEDHRLLGNKRQSISIGNIILFCPAVKT